MQCKKSMCVIHFRKYEWKFFIAKDFLDLLRKIPLSRILNNSFGLEFLWDFCDRCKKGKIEDSLEWISFQILPFFAAVSSKFYWVFSVSIGLSCRKMEIKLNCNRDSKFLTSKHHKFFMATWTDLKEINHIFHGSVLQKYW